MDFIQTFKNPEKKITKEKVKPVGSQRDKFLSRVFAIFSEDIVRIAYKKDKKHGFVDLGRPTIRDKTTNERFTLDFLLSDTSYNYYVTEMKCELEYKDYANLELKGADQIEEKRRRKKAFALLLKLGDAIKSNTAKMNFEINYKPSDGSAALPIDFEKLKGIALVWGRLTPKGVDDAHSAGFSHVISVEDIINELIENNDKDYFNLLSEHHDWCNALFDSMKK